MPTGSVANCTTYSAPNVCSVCASGYSLIGVQCQAYCDDPANIIGTMQTFTAANCSSYATPAPLGYTAIGCLTDSRDGKAYEIRKFADGNCWMVDNLAYGGTTDACASKTTFDGGANFSGAAWGYGDCRNNPGTNYGYLYNWQAAMQHASAYYNNNYTGPTDYVQGICPTGWHLPSAYIEFFNLYRENGGTEAGAIEGVGGYQGCPDASCTFFNPGGNFKGVHAGYSGSDGTIYRHHGDGRWWSSNQGYSYRTTDSYCLEVNSDYLAPGNTAYGCRKNSGFSVRCVF